MGTIALPDKYDRSMRAYISGKAQVPMLQLICYTFGTLKWNHWNEVYMALISCDLRCESLHKRFKSLSQLLLIWQTYLGINL